MRTPGGITPDSSRPGTPEERLNIFSGEQDGLPIASSNRGRTFTRDAAKLVALHKAKSMILPQRPGPSHANDKSHHTSPSIAKARKALYNDEVPAGAQKSTRGIGVLSALLTLYEQPQKAHSSQATPVDNGVEPLVSDQAPGAPSATPATGPPLSATTHRVSEDHSIPPSLHENKGRLNQPHLGNFFRETASRLSDYHQGSYDRPPEAKSRGGVFGALQASAIGLAGPATPTASTVAPAPERPGFKLK